jgi:hypothetical protein
VESQLCGVDPLHPIVPGVHWPTQLPPLQTYGHAAVSCHCPAKSQSWGVSPKQRIEPGVQRPVAPSEASATSGGASVAAASLPPAPSEPLSGTVESSPGEVSAAVSPADAASRPAPMATVPSAIPPSPPGEKSSTPTSELHATKMPTAQEIAARTRERFSGAVIST